MCDAARETPLPTLLVLEHHDSYTRNILSMYSELPGSSRSSPCGNNEDPDQRIIWQYENWKDRIVIVNVDDITWEHFEQQVLPHVACVILGPGPGSPHKQSDFSWPARLIAQYGDELPVFGLCLGHQGIATSFGAHVDKAAAPRHGQVTRIRHLGDALFTDVPSEFDTVQYNSLTVKSDSLPDHLEPIAWTTNRGQEEILGLKHRTKPLWGVQYHPESISSTYGACLLSNFLALATRHYQRSPRRLDLSKHLPPHVMALSTSHRTKQTPGSPLSPRQRKPSPTPSAHTWEQRSFVLTQENSLVEPRQVFEHLIRGSSALGEVWLDSSRPTVSAQFSHMFAPETVWTYTRPTNVLCTRHAKSSPTTRRVQAPETLFDILDEAQQALRRRTRIVSSDKDEGDTLPLGFFGYFGYEMKEESMPLSNTGMKDERDDAEFAFCNMLLSFDHERRRWIATGLIKVDDLPERQTCSDEDLISRLGVTEDAWNRWLDRVKAFFAAPRDSRSSTSAELAPDLNSMVPDQGRTAYMKAIERARASIIAGDAYELCLTTQFRTTLPREIAADPYELYLSLRARNPSPYAYYFHLPQSNLALLSSSPERFMRITKDGLAVMKPIKGTVRRCLDDPVEDQRRRDALQADEKERAENLMIVDLSRNDLLGFCDIESVKVPKLMVVESYQTVHQLVTSVEGQLMPDVNPFEAIGRAFPPGSMTGAPKLRSLKLLDDLEAHKPRGVYSGIFGYVAVDGTTDFSVVIRTLVVKGTEMTMGAGGAITHLSDAAKEWDEVLIKKEAVLGVQAVVS